MNHSPQRITFVVGESDGAVRLDKLLAARIEGLSRSGARSLFDSGAVRVNGRRAKKGDVAQAGSTIEVDLGPPRRAVPNPKSPLTVRHESASIVVVAKPAGQATAPLTGTETETLANALVGRYPEMATVGFSALEPGILHRLDTHTSGLVVAARSKPAFDHLRHHFDALEKRYLAIVDATVPEAGVIETPLEPDPEHSKLVRVALSGAPRRTEYRRQSVQGQWALVEVEARRAYRHQVRVHLARAGHPIAGDTLYGGTPVASLAPRHALHASYIAWAGDDSVGAFEVREALPETLADLLAV